MKYDFIPLIVLVCVITACSSDYPEGHHRIPFRNKTDKRVAVDWTFESNQNREIQWLLRHWERNNNYIIAAHETGWRAIFKPAYDPFEWDFDRGYNSINGISFDTLYVFVIDFEDLQLATEKQIQLFDYTLYKCSQKDLDDKQWTIVFPDMFEDSHGQIKQYCVQ